LSRFSSAPEELFFRNSGLLHDLGEGLPLEGLVADGDGDSSPESLEARVAAPLSDTAKARSFERFGHSAPGGWLWWHRRYAGTSTNRTTTSG